MRCPQGLAVLPRHACLLARISSKSLARKVHYEDGSLHSYTTLERPNLHFNAAGQLTHINLAADMQTQDQGCAAYPGGKNKGGFLQCPSVVKGRCACTNCKYADHAGTIIIELDYE